MIFYQLQKIWQYLFQLGLSEIPVERSVYMWIYEDSIAG